jgi:hypothetical protein
MSLPEKIALAAAQIRVLAGPDVDEPLAVLTEAAFRYARLTQPRLVPPVDGYSPGDPKRVTLEHQEYGNPRRPW